MNHRTINNMPAVPVALPVHKTHSMQRNRYLLLLIINIIFLFLMINSVIASSSMYDDSIQQAALPSSIELKSDGRCINSLLTVTGVTSKAYRIQWKRDGEVISENNMPSPISTVAGGAMGDRANQLRFPLGICSDTANNIYIADQYNHRVQKWAPGANEGITVAGGKGQGNGADQLNYPYGVIVDKSGNLYIADAGNHRVQKWAPGATQGITIAGGNRMGSNARQLAFPYGLSIDQNGAIYVADNYNHRIQKWVPGAEAGVTVAGGNGSGDRADQLQYPNGVFVDKRGVIYIADSRNDRIQCWVPGATKGVTVAGGNGRGDNTNQLYYPTTVYVDDNQTLYVADFCNHRIMQWVANASKGVTIAGTDSVTDQFSYPYSLCFDSKGNLYVSDEQGHRVRKYNSDNQASAYDLQATVPGSYRVAVLFRNGASETTGEVIIDPVPGSGMISGTDTLCVSASALLSNNVPKGIWSSNNPAVVTIDSTGLINAVAGGNALISYTIINPHGCASTSTMPLTIGALPSVPVISGVDTLMENTKSVFNSDMPNGKWSSSNELIARIGQYGEVTAATPGTTNIAYEISNAWGCKALAKVAVTVKQSVQAISMNSPMPFGKIRRRVAIPLSTSPYKNTTTDKNILMMVADSTAAPDLKVTVYGNPVTAFFSLRIQGDKTIPVLLRVTDMLGRVVELKRGLTVDNTIQFGENYMRGTYIVELVQGRQRQVLKLVKV